jgi:predicted DCC family thiol-disulfide oxidoreductase YuxK
VDDVEKQSIHSNLDRVSEYIAQRTRPRDTERRGGSGSATHKPITRRQYKQYKTNRYRRSKKGKKSLKPKHLKRNRRRS